MKIDEITSILDKTYSFGGQSKALLNVLAFSAQKLEFSTGDLIVKSDDKTAKCLVMLKGRAFIQKKETSIELRAGDIIGNLALINDKPIKYAIIGGSKVKKLMKNLYGLKDATANFEFKVREGEMFEAAKSAVSTMTAEKMREATAQHVASIARSKVHEEC